MLVPDVFEQLERLGLLDELERLRREAAALSARFTAASDPTERHVGSDPTGTVSVGVSGDATAGHLDGLRVDVASDWRLTLGPAGLGQAVRAAVAEAVRERFVAWADRFCANPPPRPVRLGPFDTGDGSGRWSLVKLGEPQSLATLDDRVSRVLDDADRLAAGTRESHRPAGEPVHGVSVGGRVRVVLLGGAVTDIVFDRRWLGLAAPWTIGEHLGQALRLAYAAGAPPGAAELP
jgi:hypothetical protein